MIDQSYDIKSIDQNQEVDLDFGVTSEELISIFGYIISKAAVPTLISQCNIIENFLGKDILNICNQ